MSRPEVQPRALASCSAPEWHRESSMFRAGQDSGEPRGVLSWSGLWVWLGSHRPVGKLGLGKPGQWESPKCWRGYSLTHSLELCDHQQEGEPWKGNLQGARACLSAGPSLAG